jgi:hypothetical protein
MDMAKESYRRQLAALREENEHLRSSARTFGELAERLATELRRVRAQSDLSVAQNGRAAIMRRLSTAAVAGPLRRFARR